MLSQVQKDESLRSCAYLSQRLFPAEINYEIYDKKLLSIIQVLKEWRSELKMVPRFTIVTDYKNLRYFHKKQQLTERQIYWADLLEEFDFELYYCSGKQAIRLDILSQQEQDRLWDPDDECILYRFRTLFEDTSKTSI